MLSWNILDHVCQCRVQQDSNAVPALQAEHNVYNINNIKNIPNIPNIQNIQNIPKYTLIYPNIPKYT